MRLPEVGQHVLYIDDAGFRHDALVAGIDGARLHLLFVERELSWTLANDVPHATQAEAGGYWRWTGDSPKKLERR